MGLKNKKGSVLILAMWALVFLAILNVALYKIVSSQVELVKRYRREIISPYLAKAACQYAKARQKSDSTEYDALSELKEPQEVEVGKGKFTYTITDEESKINVNTAPAEVLARLPGLDETLADGIVSSARRPFSVKEELLLIDGIDREIFNGFKDFITVYGSGSVNLNTVSEDAMAVLGMDSDLIQIIKRYRAGPDGEEGTGDDRVFEGAGSIVNQLREYSGLFSAQELLIIEL
ncbi:MAG: helix-hairpin-helix domain-containing protein, partial [Candidatus Omnitrophica bacterium]|nr:helix-hairpin-helix domain-containing protein [Candidatus Omnitrophota bacterium]